MAFVRPSCLSLHVLLSSDPTGQADDAGFREGVIEQRGPRLAIFLVALPDPLPIADGTTFTKMLDGVIPEWAHLEAARPTENVDDFPAVWGGRHFVSLKLWQLEEPSMGEDSRALQAAIAVAHQILGEQPPADLDDADVPPTYRTVVEMVTTVSDPSRGHVDGDPVDDPLTRCLNFLMDIFRSYRIARSALVPELTYVRLPSFTLLYWRDPLADGSGIVGGPILVMHDHPNLRHLPAPALMTQEEVDHLGIVLGRREKGDPLMIYKERLLEANLARMRYGDHANAVVQLAMSIEVLLDRVLSLMIWEETLGRPDHLAAARSLGLDLRPKLRQQYHVRLGGQWDITAGALAAWDTGIARLRGRVVHAGYRPTSSEVETALAAAAQMEAFVLNRLTANLVKYKRTALLILGEPGLRRRQVWHKVSRFAENEADTEPDWLKAFITWRDAVDLQIAQL